MLTAMVFTAMALAAAWDPSIEAYRAMLVRFNHDKNVTSADVAAWATTTRAARIWMAQTDPDYPLYHLATPEGWNNDPNGVTFDPKDGGLYHRFYQYDKTYSDACRHGKASKAGCVIGGKARALWPNGVHTVGVTVTVK